MFDIARRSLMSSMYLELNRIWLSSSNFVRRRHSSLELDGVRSSSTTLDKKLFVEVWQNFTTSHKACKLIKFHFYWICWIFYGVRGIEPILPMPLLAKIWCSASHFGLGGVLRINWRRLMTFDNLGICELQIGWAISIQLAPKVSVLS